MAEPCGQSSDGSCMQELQQRSPLIFYSISSRSSEEHLPSLEKFLTHAVQIG